jgi:hypothetical protein
VTGRRGLRVRLWLLATVVLVLDSVALIVALAGRAH